MIIELSAAAVVGGVIGFLACAVFASGKVAEMSRALWNAEEAIDRALDQVTPGANATVKRIARILKGEA